MATEGIKFEPPAQSRDEDILYTTLQGQLYEEETESRIEDLLVQLNKAIISGSGFTPTETQLTAMNSGIDSEKVAQIGTNKTDISNLGTSLSSTSSDEGKVLTADGQGGYSWQDSQSGGKKYFYQMNLSIKSFSNSSAQIRCNLQLISSDPNLYPTGTVNEISYQRLLSDFLKLDKTSGYAQIVNISNVSIAPNGGNSPFEMVSYVRINLANDHWFLQTNESEIELTAKTSAIATYAVPYGTMTEI